MPTRNRADMFKRALDSVLAQTGAAFEVVVVNDGTSGTEAAGLDRVKAEVGDAARFIDLPVTQSGHGCFRVMNTGAVNSTGDYLCFLDDDDMWVDAEHLADADRVITRAGAAVDAVFFDQVAYRGDVIADGPIWLEDLGARLRKTGDNHNGFEVDATTLLSAHGFAHTNTVIVRRSTFLEIGGFDTKLWYEGDRDFFLRLLDASSTLLYRPTVCARHNIPESAARSSMSNSTSALNKSLDQIRLLHKAARLSHHPEIVKYARQHRRYALRKALHAAGWKPAFWTQLLKLLPSLMQSPPRTAEVVAITVPRR